MDWYKMFDTGWNVIVIIGSDICVHHRKNLNHFDTSLSFNLKPWLGHFKLPDDQTTSKTKNEQIFIILIFLTE